jgi:hypothetical protein
LGAHYGVKFFDSLGDFLRGKLFDALDEDFLGGVRLNRDETLGIEGGLTDSLLSLRVKNTLQFCTSLPC